MPTKQGKDSDRIIGQNIRKLRMLRGMSQEKLGDALGLTFQQVQKYEKGTNRCSGGRLYELTVILQCGVLDLFAGVSDDAANKRTVDDPISSLANSSIGLRMAKVFPKLPREMQTAIVDLCELQRS